MVGGAPLDGGGHNLTSPLIGLFLGASLDLLDLDGSLVGDIRLHLSDQVILGLIGGEAGNALQHLHLAVLDVFDLLRSLVGGGVFCGESFLFLLDGIHLVIEVFLLLLQSALLLLQVGTALLDLSLVFAAVFQNLFFSFKKCFSLFIFRTLDGFVDDAGGFFLRTGDFSFRYAFAIANTEEEKDHRRNDEGSNGYDPADCRHDRYSSYVVLTYENG